MRLTPLSARGRASIGSSARAAGFGAIRRVGAKTGLRVRKGMGVADGLGDGVRDAVDVAVDVSNRPRVVSLLLVSTRSAAMATGNW